MTTPPPTREERLERALRELISATEMKYKGSTDRQRSNGISPRMERALSDALLALHPAADGEETKP